MARTSQVTNGLAKSQLNAATVLNAWVGFRDAIGVVTVRNANDYAKAQLTLEALLNEIGDDETHPLADVLDYLSDQVAAYEDAHSDIPQAPAREVLRHLMEQSGLKQQDLSDCAPQSRISEILNGKRAISTAIAKRFALRFGVPVGVFLD